MDTTKLGLTTAKAMDQLEKFVNQGRIPEDAVMGACVIVVALDAKTADDAPDRENLRDVTTQFFIFSEPENIYIEQGVLHMVLNDYARMDEGDD